MSDRNIKNSTIIRVIISVIIKLVEKLPVITVESNSVIMSKKVGETNIIKIEISMHANPQSISINAVKYLEFKS